MNLDFTNISWALAAQTSTTPDSGDKHTPNELGFKWMAVQKNTLRGKLGNPETNDRRWWTRCDLRVFYHLCSPRIRVSFHPRSINRYFVTWWGIPNPIQKLKEIWKLICRTESYKKIFCKKKKITVERIAL